MREMFRRNLGYKIISLILAILFWLWVTNQGTTQSVETNQPFTVSLVTKNLPVNSEVMTKLPSVRVVMQGFNPSVNVSDLYAYVDLSSSEPGIHTYEIKMEPIPNMSVVEINPKTVTLEIDAIQEKMFPVQLKVSGEPASGKKVGEAIISPEMVNVRGPSSLLNSIHNVEADVSVQGASNNIKASRPVIYRDKNGQAVYGPDPSANSIIANPASVDLIVPIIPKELGSKMIPVRVSQKGKPFEGYKVRSIQIFPDSVQVLGPSEVLNTLNSITIGTMDLSGMKADTAVEFSSNNVSLPSGVTFETPASFKVIVDVGETEQTKVISVPVTVKNIADNLKLESNPASVEIKVKGMPENLKKLTAGQIDLWVEAQELGAGSHPDRKVYWQLPAGVEMVTNPSVSFVLVSKSELPETPEPTTPANPE